MGIKSCRHIGRCKRKTRVFGPWLPETPQGKCTYDFFDPSYTCLPSTVYREHREFEDREEELSEGHSCTNVVDEYYQEEFEFQLELQKKYMPDPEYLDNQPHINPVVRSIFLNFMYFIVKTYNVEQRIFPHSVSLLDRYLSLKVMSLDDPNECTSIALGCLSIAVKYETQLPLNADDFIRETHAQCTPERVYDAEVEVLNVLDHNVTCADPYYFLDRVMEDDSEEAKTMASFVLQFIYYDPVYMTIKPRTLVCYSAYIARSVLFTGDYELWTQKDVSRSGGVIMNAKDLGWVRYFVHQLSRTHVGTVIFWNLTTHLNGYPAKRLRQWVSLVSDQYWAMRIPM